MPYWFVEWLSIIWCEMIKRFGMESRLKTNIHSIIDDDDRKNQTNHKLITPWTVFDTHCRCKCDNKSWVGRRHASASEHIRKAKFSLHSMNKSFYHYRNKKCWEGYEKRIIVQVWLDDFEHIILFQEWYIPFFPMEQQHSLHLVDFSQ